MAASDRPKLLVAAPDGVVYEHPTLEMAIDNGQDVSRAGAKDLIALPEVWDLMAMPGTRPVGYDPLAAKFTTLTSFTVDGRTFEPWAVAVHPPPGYVRAFHPAAEYTDSTHPDLKLRALQTSAEEQAPPSPASSSPAASKRRGLPVIDAGGDDNARPGLPLWAY